MSKCVFNKSDQNLELQSELGSLLEELWDIEDNLVQRQTFINKLKDIGEGYELTSLSSLADYISEFVQDYAPDLQSVLPTNIATCLAGNITNIDTVTESNPTKLDKLDFDDSEPKHYRSYLNNNYGIATGVASGMEASFVENIVKSIFVNRDTESFPRNEHDINENIRLYQESLVKDIVAYLKDKFDSNPEILKKLSEIKMYKNGIYTGAVETLNSIGNLYLHHSHFTSDELIRRSEVTGYLPYAKFIKAYNSLVILNNFDTILSNKIGTVVKINYNYPAFTAEDKYYIEGTGANNYRTWGDKEKDIDMNEQIADINKIMIETTPIYTYGSDIPRTNAYLRPESFSYIISKLKNLVYNPDSSKVIFDSNFFKTYPELSDLRTSLNGSNLRNLLETLVTSPENYHKLFKILCSKAINDYTVFSGIVPIEKDLIWSMNKGIFGDTKSLYSINSKNPEFSYYNSLCQVASTANFMSFFQYKVNEEGALVKTNLSDNILQNDIRAMKKALSSRLSSASDVTFNIISSKYSPKFENEIFSFTIPNTEFSVEFDPKKPRNLAFKVKRAGKPIGFFKGKEDWYKLSEFFSDLTGMPIHEESPLNSNFLSLYNTLGNIQYDNAISDMLQLSTSLYFGTYFSHVLAKDITNLNKYKDLQKNIFGEANSTSFIKGLNDLDIINKSYVPVVANLAIAKSMETRNYATGLTKDSSGNNLSTTLTSTLGNTVYKQLSLQDRNEGSAVKNLSFVKNPNLFMGTSVSREFTSLDLSKKHIDFTSTEAFYAAFVLNHLNAKVQRGIAAYMPSVLSDKSQLVHELINLGSASDLGKVFAELTEEEATQIVRTELGECYKNIVDNMKADFEEFNRGIANLSNEIKIKYGIFDNVPKLNPFTNFAEFNAEYGSFARKTLEKLQKAYQEQYGDNLELVSELYYTGNSTLSANRTLISLTNRLNPEYFANSGYNPEEIFGKLTNWENFWNIKRAELITDLLDNSFKIYVSDNFGKAIDSPEINYLRGLSSWIKSSTQEVILAKIKIGNKSYNITNKRDLARWNYIKDGVTYNVYSKGFKLNDMLTYNNAELILHPDLAQFNALYYLFSNEFMLSTVGTVANHPAKKAAKDPNDLFEEAARYGGQHKRNNSITAAKQVYQLDLINGILPYSTIAVIEDDFSPVYNAMGDYDEEGVKQYDGSTFTAPDVVYLENNSLQGAEAGVVKKPFAHFYKERTASGGMVKTAGFGLTNKTMIKSLFLQRMCKKMWSRPWAINKNVLIDYNGNPIQYRDIYYKGTDGKFYSVTNITYNPDGTYTINKVETDYKGDIINEVEPVITPKIGESPKTIHGLTLYPINTNFALFQMFGGWNSYELSDNGLVRSENSIKNVVDAINKVGDKLSDVVRYQKDVYQPLKEATISYVVTAGAIKQGAANVNLASAYFNDEPYLTMKFRNDDHGIQLDKEHTADDSTISMMTQVVNALCARGYSIEDSKDVYNAIESLSEVVLKDYFKGFEEFLNTKNVKSFQEAVAQTISKVIMNSKDSDGNLMNAIMEDLSEQIKSGKLLTFEDLKGKTPFSSPGLFSKLSSSISSTISKLAVKLKPNGTLSVINPSHKIWKLYGDRMLDSFNNMDEIQNLQKEYDAEPKEISEIRLGRCYKVFTDKGPIVEFINTPQQYWHFKDQYQSSEFTIVEQIAPAEAVEWDINKQEYKPYDFSEGGRDLASYNFTFRDIEGKLYNMWDLDIIKEIYNPADRNPIELRRELQRVLSNLTRYDRDFVVKVDGKPVTVDKRTLEVQPFEVIMPKIYATIFGLKESDSLSDIKDNPVFFLTRMLSNWDTKVDDENYDIELKRINGSHVYLIDNRFYKDTSLHPKEDIETRWDGGKLYRVTSTGEKLYRLGSDSDKIYVDDNGNEVIVTNNTQFYIDSFNYHSIKISDSAAKGDNIESIFQPIKNSKKKVARKFTSYIGNGVLSDVITYTNQVSKASIERLKLNPNDEVEDKYVDMIKDSANEIYTSFLKSLKVLAARIPAQSMQSFMAMSVAGFDDGSKNNAYVNYFQFWLQGSDLDIDAVSLLGYSFDKTGKYIGWSPYFNLFSEESLEASEKLPFPSNKELELVETDDVNLTNWINDFVGSGKLFNFNGDKVVFLQEFDSNNALNSLGMLAAFLRMTNRNNKLYIPKNSNLPFKEIKRIIDDHNLYLGTHSHPEEVIKNFISTKMFNISANPINIMQSHTSIDGVMKDLTTIASKSEVSTKEKEFTSGNSMNVCIGLYNYQTGKKDVGVVASAKKVFDGLTYYFDNNLSMDNTDNLLFNQNICGGNYRLLANSFSFNPVSDSEVADALLKVDQDKDAALVISALMNASVDNAKDPILSKINAGLNMMNLYTYGVTIGISLFDLGATMMSYTGRLLAKYMDSNIFMGKEGMPLYKAIQYLENGPSVDGLDPYTLSILRDIFNVESTDSTFIIGSILSNRIQNLDSGKTLIDNIRKKLREAKFDASKVNVYRFLEELDQYLSDRYITMSEVVLNTEGVPFRPLDSIKQLSMGSSEMNRIRNILNLNQDLPNKLEDKFKFIDNFENVISERIRELKKEDREKSVTINGIPMTINEVIGKINSITDEGRLSIDKFITDESYRNDLISLYNGIKHTYNVLDVIWNIPHYRSYVKDFYMDMKSEYFIFSKYRLMRDLGSRIAKDSKFNTVKQKNAMYKRLQSFCDATLRNSWLRSTNKTITIPAGVKIYNSLGIEFTTTAPTPIILGTNWGNASFKRWMEYTVIPELKESEPNNFIRDLTQVPITRTRTGNVSVVYSLSSNMLPRTPSDTEVLNKYKREFNKLSGSPRYNDIPLLDLFFYYNLIVFNNSPSPNSLANIFEDIIRTKSSPLIEDYYNFISKLDTESDLVEGIDYLYEDAMQWCAPTGNTNILTNKYVRSYDEDTMQYNLYEEKENYDDSEGEYGLDDDISYGFEEDFGETGSIYNSYQGINYDKYKLVYETNFFDIPYDTLDSPNNSDIRISPNIILHVNSDSKLDSVRYKNEVYTREELLKKVLNMGGTEADLDIPFTNKVVDTKNIKVVDTKTYSDIINHILDNPC